MKQKLRLLISFILIAVSLNVFAAEVVVSPRLSARVDAIEETTLPTGEVTGYQMRPMSELDILLASSNPEYVLRTGDSITVAYIEKAQTKPIVLTLRVPYDGSIRIPGIGDVVAGGREFGVVRNEISDMLLRNNRFSEPVIELTGLGIFSVTVKGAVHSTASVPVNGLYRLSDMLYLASSDASIRDVAVVGKDGSEQHYDLFAAMKEGKLEDNPILEPGDTVVFSPAERTITIAGEVKRPGVYQLLEGENLSELLSRYSGGLKVMSDEVMVTRSVRGNYSDDIIVDVAEDFVLLDGDVVTVSPSRADVKSLSVEGALRSTNASNIIAGSKYESYYYRFAEGETLSDLIDAFAAIFSDSSDLRNVEIHRGDEVIKVNFADILYNGASSGEMKLQAGDRIVVPFSQMFVSVTGSVVKPGLYGYVPGKTASYYINLAGGLNGNASKKGDYVVFDKNNNKVSDDSIITPEMVINVEVSNFKTDTATTTTILALVTSVLGIVATSVGIAHTLGAF